MATETPDAAAAAGSAGATFAARPQQFQTAVEAADRLSVTALLATDCWWRDLLALTWDLGTYRGEAAITTMLEKHLSPGAITGLEVVTEFGPRFQGDDTIIEGFITFETPLGQGRGAVRLQQEAGQWVAWTVMTELDDLHGHERAIGKHRSRGPRHSPPAAPAATGWTSAVTSPPTPTPTRTSWSSARARGA